MVQVDPIKPTLKAPGTNLLTLIYVESLSIFAFKFNLRRYSVVRIARLAKLLRILRSSRIFSRFENSMTINYGALKLFKFCAGTLFIAHWMACFWHLIKVWPTLNPKP